MRAAMLVRVFCASLHGRGMTKTEGARYAITARPFGGERHPCVLKLSMLASGRNTCRIATTETSLGPMI